jgi:hypothetical protein
MLGLIYIFICPAIGHPGEVVKREKGGLRRGGVEGNELFEYE